MPRYGGGHDDKDTFSNFESGTVVPGKDALAPAGDIYAPRYGGKHEEKDTEDHFVAGSLAQPEVAQTRELQGLEGVAAPHYGGGHKDMDTVDHFKAGTFDIEEGAEMGRSVVHMGISHGSYAQIGSELRETGQKKKWKQRRKKQENVPWATLAHLEKVRRKPKPQPEQLPKKKKKKKSKKKKVVDSRPLHQRGIRESLVEPVLASMARKQSNVPTLPALAVSGKAPSNGGAGGGVQGHSLVQAEAENALHQRLAAQKARVLGLKGQPFPMQTYGGGTNKDLEDHFEGGMGLGVDGEKSHKEQFGDHYGGTSDTRNDTFSHLAAGAMAPDSGLTDRTMFGGHMGGHEHADRDHIQVGALVPDTGAILLNHNNAVAPKWGRGHEDLDTYDHFDKGTNLGNEGAKSYIEMYGEHQGGTDMVHNDTFSNMQLGHGLIPNKPSVWIKPYTKPTNPPPHFKLTGAGYLDHNASKGHPTYPQDTSKIRGTMVYPGKVVVRPETLDTGTYDHRYVDADAVAAARRNAEPEELDGMITRWPGYRAAKPARSYEMKFTARQHRLHKGDQRGGQDQHDLLR